jgi:hypothetical protein
VPKEVHSRRKKESTCLNSIPPCRLHFQRWPSIILISKTQLPNIITVRSATPMSSVIFMSFPVDELVTFTAALLQTRQTAVFLHLLYKLDLLTPTACLLPSLIACPFSTSFSARCFNFASANHNVHAVSHAVFHLFEFQPLSLLVLHPSADKTFTVDATTSLCA